MKRIIAVVIALMLCLSVVSMTALAEGQYFVAGVGTLCGSEWAVDDPMNAMTDKGDGTFAILYPNVSAGSYQFKVTAGNWDQSWGKDGQNYTFEVSKACDVTISFNPSTGEITVSGEHVGEVTGITIDAIRVVGNGTVDWLNGAAWDTGADVNKMTANGSVYTITYKNVPAGTDYKFKFAANGSWDNNWGLPTGTALEVGTAMDAVFNSQDITLSLSEPSDVTITLDLSAFEYSTKAGAKLTVTTKAASGATETPDATEGNQGGETTEETLKVYAHIPAGWTAPGVWAWDDNQKNAFSAWPGLAMTEGDDGWWSAEVPAWVQNIIINGNGGSAQTADLDMEQQADMWIVVADDNSAVIYFEKPDLSEITPPTEATQAPTEATDAPTEATEPEATEPAQPQEPANDNLAGTVILWVVVLVLSAGVGVGAVLLIHYIRNKKK